MADNTYNNDPRYVRTDDNIQHGIDDNPDNDAAKGAGLGAVGGAVVGMLAGGPVGAVVGGVAGAVASGLGVAAVDQVDNDNTVSGLGDPLDTNLDGSHTTTAHIHRNVTDTVNDGDGNNLPGIQTGGRTLDGTPDTRGIGEKAADAITGDRIDDKTGKIVR